MAATEPAGWEVAGTKMDKPAAEKVAGGSRRAGGTGNVVGW